MKNFRNRPVITKEDHPQLIAQALRESIPFYNRDIPERAFAWGKTACDAYEAIEDAFGLNYTSDPEQFLDRDSTIFMSADELELALVAYGVHHIMEAAEVQKVDQLLVRIDGLKAGTSDSV